MPQKSDKQSLVPIRVQAGMYPVVWVTYVAWNDEWVTLEEYRITLHGHKFAIPKGFEYDQSSIPRIFWSVIASHELGLLPPLIHDWLFRHNGKICLEPGCETISRKETNDIFLTLMEAQRISKWKRRIAYRFVEWFSRRW